MSDLWKSEMWSSFDLEEELDGKPPTSTITAAVEGPVILHTTNTEPVLAWIPAQSEENIQVATTYEITFTDGSTRVVEASAVSTDNNRIIFLGPVEGYSGPGQMVGSFLGDRIAEYRVVPVLDEPRVGTYTYRITFSGPDAKSQDVVADRLLFNQGSEKGSGQFTLVTGPKDKSVTEFMIGEQSVFSIARVTDSGDDVKIPAPATADENVSA